jgi:hypothetical protein
MRTEERYRVEGQYLVGSKKTLGRLDAVSLSKQGVVSLILLRIQEGQDEVLCGMAYLYFLRWAYEQSPAREEKVGRPVLELPQSHYPLACIAGDWTVYTYVRPARIKPSAKLSVVKAARERSLRCRFLPCCIVEYNSRRRGFVHSTSSTGHEHRLKHPRV